MNLNQLRYFIAVAESGSFTKAASQYFISQTAITLQIRALEESMGVELFDRSSRPVSLTPAGCTFLMDAKAILERMSQAVRRVHEASVGLVGTLRIGYTKGYERSDLSDRLRGFHRNYPNILVSCYRCDTDMLASGLLNDEFDIIFTWDSTNIASNESVSYVTVERSPLVVALYSSHPFSQRTSLSRRDLKNEKLIYMSPSRHGNSSADDYFLNLYRQAGYQPDLLFRSNDVESILMMVAAEEGISILPSYMTRKLTNADNLKFIPLPEEEEFMDILAVWQNSKNNAGLRHFVEEICGKND